MRGPRHANGSSQRWLMRKFRLQGLCAPAKGTPGFRWSQRARGPRPWRAGCSGTRASPVGRPRVSLDSRWPWSQRSMSIDNWMQSGEKDKAAKWKPIIDNKRFWHTLPWQPGGQILWSYINNYSPHILSAYVEHATDPNCIPGKRFWAQSHLGLPTGRINLVKRREKQNLSLIHI